MPAASDPLDRLLNRMTVLHGPLDTDCWISTYHRNTSGYVQFSVRNRFVLAHRFMYEHFTGPIPAGLEIDHLCGVKTCICPDHLEAVTSSENTQRWLRRVGGRPRLVRLTCRAGHSLTDVANVIARQGRGPVCRTCVNARWRDGYHRRTTAA